MVRDFPGSFAAEEVRAWPDPNRGLASRRPTAVYDVERLIINLQTIIARLS